MPASTLWCLFHTTIEPPGSVTPPMGSLRSKPHDPMSNPEVALARRIVENTGTHVFLTGKAGTGKTTFLRRLAQECPKRMVVLAPTGIAAINAGGVTIHSFLQLPFNAFVPGREMPREQFRMSKRKLRLIRSLDLIVIDEISMVRADLLDHIDATLRLFRDRYQPFGGIQLLMIGDLQQLSPVVRDEDQALLAQHYATPYFFSAHALQHTEFVTIELRKVYRQTDTHFLDLLNAVRTNRADATILAALNARYRPDFCPTPAEGYVRLVTHNHQADAINHRELDRLTTPTVSYRAEVSGIFPETSYPAAEQLTLKVGAQVMFIKNDSGPQRRFFNGMLGEVIALHAKEAIVRPHDGDEDLTVTPETWRNVRYTLNEESKAVEEVVEGTFAQLPLRPAWAITIHKSQGLTFERAIIDVHGAFAHGQTYVALSRCKTLEGMVLAAPLPPQAIIQDGAVLHFLNASAAHTPDEGQVGEMERSFFIRLLDDLFGTRSLSEALAAFVRLLEEFFYRTHPTALADFRAHQIMLREEVAAVAERFRHQYATLITSTPDYADLPVLQDRLRKGAAYFSERLSPISRSLHLLNLATNNKATAKRLERTYGELKEHLRVKTALLRHVAQEGFDRPDYQHTRALILVDEESKGGERKERRRKPDSTTDKPATTRQPRAPKPLKEPKVPTTHITLDLFNQGRTVEQIAAERRLAPTTIFGHLTQCVLSNELSVLRLISAERLATISSAIDRLEPPFTLTELHNLLPDFSFGELRLAQLLRQKAEEDLSG